ncbi:MAG: flagellar hook-basal body complex protein [Acetobacteraceae bacterium]
MQNATTIALSRLVAQQRSLDVTAANLANSSTPGFKAERMLFADFLDRQKQVDAPRGGGTLDYTQDRATYRNQEEGAITHTANPLDLAVGGNGFFTVMTAQGPRITRAGRFSLQPNGTIGDVDGNALLDTSGQPVRVSPADTTLQVAGDGTLSSENGMLGKIGVVQPNNPNTLQAQGGRLFNASSATTVVASPHIVQGALEESNVQPIEETTKMMSDLREFQFVTQFVQAESDRQQSAIDKLTQQKT